MTPDHGPGHRRPVVRVDLHTGLRIGLRIGHHVLSSRFEALGGSRFALNIRLKDDRS
jgi:hypothetical protein